MKKTFLLLALFLGATQFANAGCESDGDVIYADPHEGEVKVVSANYFNGCDAFEIGGINQSQMRMLLQ